VLTTHSKSAGVRAEYDFDQPTFSPSLPTGEFYTNEVWERDKEEMLLFHLIIMYKEFITAPTSNLNYLNT